MKLYTEEQVRRAMLHSYLSGVERPADYLPIEESILRELTPIELPSDEEIKERRKEDFKIGYNQGFLDAQLNHVNDADNLAEERDYLQSQIDDVDKKIKEAQNKIASLLINGESDPEIKGWTIGPFGTPEKL